MRGVWTQVVAAGSVDIWGWSAIDNGAHTGFTNGAEPTLGHT